MVIPSHANPTTINKNKQMMDGCGTKWMTSKHEQIQYHSTINQLVQEIRYNQYETLQSLIFPN